MKANDMAESQADDKTILEQASKLGELIGQHPSAQKLDNAAKAFEADVASQRALVDYQRFAQSLQQKAQQGLPIEVEDKRKLDELQQAVITNPLLANMQRAEMDYLDLLRMVDGAIVASGGGGAMAAPAQPTGPGGLAGGPQARPIGL